MVFEEQAFTRVILDFLRASAKDVEEIQSCWSKMRTCMNNMDETIESYQRERRAEEDMQDRLGTNFHAQYIDLGSGRCGSPRYGRVTAITKQAFRDSIKIGSIFCSPLPDRMIPEQIPDGTRLNNNFIVCYDLVKIWKEPFENPYKLGAKYKVDGETTWHKIDGDVHRMDVKQGTWLVGVQFAKYDNSSNATNGRLYWQWEKNKEYAECYNLAETEKKIELRNQRDGSGKFSISIAQHDMLWTLDGYDDSGN